MDRRSFIKGLLGATGAAVAAHFGAPEYMGEEIRQELVKDLSRTQIAMPGEVFDNRPIWTSVSGVRDVWVEHVSRELAAQIDADILKQLQPKIGRTVDTMVRAVDHDLAKAQIEDGNKVIMEMPRVRIISDPGAFNRDRLPSFELKAGLEKKESGLFGDKTHRVGYLQEAIIV